MENMTAAEARTRTPGNVSPGPAHMVGASSVSQPSEPSEQPCVVDIGASTRLCIAVAPRQWNPALPPLPRRSRCGSGGLPSELSAAASASEPAQCDPHRGDTGGDGSAPQAFQPNAGHAQQQHHINPIFHVPSGKGGHGTTLPPFRRFAASIRCFEHRRQDSQMLYAQARASGPLPHKLTRPAQVRVLF